KMIDEARRTSAAAGIDAHAGIAVWYPFLGIDDFPILILVARSGGNVGMLAGHALPRAWIAVLKRQAFGICAAPQNPPVTTLRPPRSDCSCPPATRVRRPW